MTVTGPGAAFAGAGAAVAGTTERALATARELAVDSGCCRSRSPTRTAPPTTRPPRSPRTCSSRSRTPPSGWPRAPACRARRSSRSCARPSRTGPRTAPSAPSPARSPAATRTSSRATAPRSPSARPTSPASTTRSPTPPARSRRVRRGGRMRTARSVAEVREALRPARREERRIGLVPTMGALHEGHLSLIRRARADCDVVVVSLFVNPTQFNEAADLAAYPRDEERDAALAAEAGADVAVRAARRGGLPARLRHHRARSGLTEHLEGAASRHRPLRGRRHRRGQAAEHGRARRRRTSARRTPSRSRSSAGWPPTSTCPSRSTPARRSASPTGWRSPAATSTCAATTASAPRLCVARLDAAERAHAEGERDPVAIAGAGRAAMALHGVEPEYIALVRPDDLTPVQRADGEVLVAVAARVGTDPPHRQHHPRIRSTRKCRAPSRTSGSPTTPRGCR